jgi:ABC-type uncharacterized transport system auxiliary subunit
MSPKLRRVTALGAVAGACCLLAACGSEAREKENHQLEGAQSKAQEAVSKSEIEKKAAEAQSAGPEGG